MSRIHKPFIDGLRMMVGRAIVRLVDDAGEAQALQLELLADEVMEGVERHQDYGLSSVPLPGATAVTLSLGGQRGRSLAIAVGDRRYRLTGLAAGEVALHDDQGQKLHLTRDGIVIVTPFDLTAQIGGDVAVTAEGNATLTADAVVVHSDNIQLGGAGGHKVALVGDAVAGGVITGPGATKVKAT